MQWKTKSTTVTQTHLLAKLANMNLPSHPSPPLTMSSKVNFSFQ